MRRPSRCGRRLGAWNGLHREPEGRRGRSFPERAFSRAPRQLPSSSRPAGDHVVTDGPFAETKEQVGGLLRHRAAPTSDDALEWAKKVPMAPGGSIEVRPVIDYSQFGAEEPAAQGSAAS